MKTKREVGRFAGGRGSGVNTLTGCGESNVIILASTGHYVDAVTIVDGNVRFFLTEDIADATLFHAFGVALDIAQLLCGATKSVFHVRPVEIYPDEPPLLVK